VPDQDTDQVRQADNRWPPHREPGELSRSPGRGTAAPVGEEGPGLRSRRRPDNPWLAASPSGAAYAAHFDALAAHGVDIHAEARLVASLVAPGGSVLDAGCGTGRVAIRLAELGHAVAGVDLDASMLAEARRRAPCLNWRLADLADLDPPAAPFDAAIAAGNVFPYLTPGTGAAVLVNLAAQLRPGGLLIAGFTLDPAKLPLGDQPGEHVTLARYDTWCAAAALSLAYRWAGWDRAPYVNGDYAVSVHRRAA
jgi:SAM-dependent methyltransferase